MKGLILKDIYSLRAYWKQYFIMLGAFAAISIAIKNNIYFASLCAVMGINFMFSVITIEENGGFCFSMALPVSRRKIVTEKYIFMLLIIAGLALLTLVMGAVGAVFGSSFSELAGVMAVVLLYNILFISIMLPVCLKWTTEKARIVFMAAIFIPIIGVFVLSRFMSLDQFLEKIKNFMIEVNTAAAVGLVALSGVLVYGVSYILSVKIFSKKEF